LTVTKFEGIDHPISARPAFSQLLPRKIRGSEVAAWSDIARVAIPSDQAGLMDGRWLVGAFLALAGGNTSVGANELQRDVVGDRHLRSSWLVKRGCSWQRHVSPDGAPVPRKAGRHGIAQSRLRRGLCETVGLLLASPVIEGRRQFAVVPHIPR
jgi:hypothetical protein